MLDFARRLAPQAAGAAVPVMAPRFGPMAVERPLPGPASAIEEGTGEPAPAAALHMPHAKTAPPASPATAVERARPATPDTDPLSVPERPPMQTLAGSRLRAASGSAAEVLLPAATAPLRSRTLEMVRSAAIEAPQAAEPSSQQQPLPPLPPLQSREAQARPPVRSPLSDVAIARRSATVAQQREDAVREQRRQDGAPPRPIVELTIDRLEVRAAVQPAQPPAAAPRPAAAPSISLGDYLRQGARR